MHYVAAVVCAVTWLGQAPAEPTKPIAGEFQLHQRLAPYIRSAAQSAAGQGERMLVVAVADPKSQGDSQLKDKLAALKQVCMKRLEGEKYSPVSSEAAEKLLQSKSQITNITPSDVTQLQGLAQFDTLLVLNWLQRAGEDKQYLRIALYSPTKKLWNGTVILQKPASSKSSAAGSGGNASVAAIGGRLSPQNVGANVSPNFRSGNAASGGNTSQAAAPRPAGNSQGHAKPAGGGSSSPRPAGSAPGTGAGTASAPRTPATSAPLVRPGASTAANVPELNRKVLEFALNHIGDQVGNGECWTLANEALISAGAEPARGYTYGTLLPSGATPLPGDIMQFTAARFVDSNSWMILGVPNHTAIVYSVSDNGTTILHQNFNGRTVKVLTLDFNKMTSGSFEVYRPIPRQTGQN